MENPIQTELILKEDVRRLLDDFAGLMKLRAVFFSAEGKMIERGRNAECSPFCRLMQEKHFGVAACVELDRKKQRECLAAKKILTYRCHAGLGEIIAPVLFLEEVAGFLVIGQFRLEEALPPGIDDRAEIDAYRALPIFAGEELRNLEHMVQVLLEYIVSKELVGYPRDMRMFRLLQYIDRHIAEPMTLANAARAVACSESTLTHYLKGHYQSCFSHIVMKKRIQKAQTLLVAHPEWTLSVIADATGFDSSFYFCRVFKKLCDMTPGEYRRTNMKYEINTCREAGSTGAKRGTDRESVGGTTRKSAAAAKRGGAAPDAVGDLRGNYEIVETQICVSRHRREFELKGNVGDIGDNGDDYISGTGRRL